MRVLAVASEIFPLVKTGGLADVTGALPLALKRIGIDMRTVIPGYPAVMKACRGKPIVRFKDLFGGKAALIACERAGLSLYVLDAPHLYDREGGPYGDASGRDWPDNWRRFAGLSRVAAEICAGVIGDWQPDLLHCHDWQAAMAPAYLEAMAISEGVAGLPSVMTIHNLAFQGQFPASIFAQLGLPASTFAVDGVEYYGGVGFLKAGLQAASAITTVSPTYANEIRTPEFGMGLDGLMNERAADLTGIVNGIDTETWDPEADRHLAATYSSRSLTGRAKNRTALAERFGLEVDEDLLLTVISRLTWQKGMDVLAAAIDALMGQGVKLALLGSGDEAIEGELLAAAARHRGRMGLVIGYDEAVAHLAVGGADAILVPSRFEPCGLTQLQGLRYGCLPIVARTGGLADTVIDANHAALNAGVATGFQFDHVDVTGLVDAVRRATGLHRTRPAWQKMQRAAMKTDVSWQHSAAEYAELYSSLSRKVARPT